MFLGTGSDVGKSILATAYCRILKNQGYVVAPFKAQNMSNNSYVTIEGGEIGRAQAAQAEAAGVLPSVYMNPVLLKPTGEMGSQVIICGNVHKNMSAADYYRYKSIVKKQVLNSYQKLSDQYQWIVLEGAGSCCEVNLRQHDIVNFEMALQINAPVIIVADIDRGGVFAQIIGSMALISEQEKKLVAGFIINKFRGNPKLFQDGIRFIESHTGKPVLGLVPYYHHIHIDMEDSMSLDASIKHSKNLIHIAVVRPDHISNFTDLEALASEPEVSINWLTKPDRLMEHDAVVIPGSKNVIYDISQLYQRGWPDALRAYLKKDRGFIIGLCGGYQMLGHRISDPEGMEGIQKEVSGFGLLDIHTIIETTKIVKKSCGKERLFQSHVAGYEIHMGRTQSGNNVIPFIDFDTHKEGSISNDGNVFGTYLHGLFDSGSFRKNLLYHIAKKNHIQLNSDIDHLDYWDLKEQNYERLAGHFQEYTQVNNIIQIAMNPLNN
jgi:adenosylcobyric acid synthase